MQIVELKAGAPVFEAGQDVDSALFPFDSLIISLQTEIAGGRSVEVESIGMKEPRAGS